MTRRSSSLVLLAAVLSASCGRTVLWEPRDSGPRSDVRPDGSLPDGSLPDVPVVDGQPIDVPTPDVPDFDAADVPTDRPLDTRVPRCGDTVIDPGESCDDGNNRDGDGCSGMCRFEARCGDNVRNAGEVCDDGNNRSGDGCRSDCLSDETCGNTIVDTARGEVCDRTPGCAMDCRSIVTCGNSRMDPGETCDDGNTTRWDGCAPDCQIEQGLVMDAFFFDSVSSTRGCDFSGDGRPDNAFGAALGDSLGIINTAINNGISNGNVLLQFTFAGLDDRLGVNDPDVRVGFTTGADGDMDRLNNRDPGNPQRINRAALNMMGLPQANFQSAITMNRISGGPEDIELNLPTPVMGMMFSFRVRRSRINGTLMNNGSRITAIDSGVLCGAVPLRDLAAVPNFFELILSGGRPGMTRSTLLEAMIGGYRVTIPFVGISLNVGPSRADIDLDGDGLEQIIGTPGNATTPPQITACIDGNGTRIMGRTCVADPRIQDAFSATFRFNGVWFRPVGVGG